MADHRVMTSLYKVYGVNSALMHAFIVLSIEVETFMTEPLRRMTLKLCIAHCTPFAQLLTTEIDRVRSGHRVLRASRAPWRYDSSESWTSLQLLAIRSIWQKKIYTWQPTWHGPKRGRWCFSILCILPLRTTWYSVSNVEKSFVTPHLFSKNGIWMKVERSPIALRYNDDVRSTTGYSNKQKIDIYLLIFR